MLCTMISFLIMLANAMHYDFIFNHASECYALWFHF